MISKDDQYSCVYSGFWVQEDNPGMCSLHKWAKKKIVMTIIREVVHSGLCYPILSTLLIKYVISLY